jgi:hypothetical protein
LRLSRNPPEALIARGTVLHGIAVNEQKMPAVKNEGNQKLGESIIP